MWPAVEEGVERAEGVLDGEAPEGACGQGVQVFAEGYGGSARVKYAAVPEAVTRGLR